MNRCVAALFASVAFVNMAQAADVVFNEPPAEVPVDAAYSWSGVYVGLQAGYGWGDAGYSNGPDASLPNEIFDDFLVDKGRGFIGGAQIGHNWQHGNVVFGAELDASFANVEGHRFLGTNIGTVEVTDELNFLGTARGRIGYAFGNILPYVTGGLAIGHYEVSGRAISDTSTHVGWTVGAGTEIGLTNQLSLKLEYLYADLGEQEYSIRDTPAGFDFPLNFDAKVQTVRIGLNYAF